MDIILASQSPRRQQLLTQMGVPFTAYPADVDETIPPNTRPSQAVLEISRRKARAVSALRPDALIIAADTVVALDDAILGKPRDAAHAKEMLLSLSGRVHRVYTGLTIWTAEKEESDMQMTSVSFRTLQEAEVDAYIATGEPMDKAGAYGIQGMGALLVNAIRGDYFNVMGLPVCNLALDLKHFGVDCLFRQFP